MTLCQRPLSSFCSKAKVADEALTAEEEDAAERDGVAVTALREAEASATATETAGTATA